MVRVDSVEGIIEDGSVLPKGESDIGDGVSSCGEVDTGAGAGAGEEVELSGAGVGTRVTEEAGGLAGDAVIGADAARVSISTFIPWLQCPIVPQMKYLLPGEESGIAVVPPV